MKPGEYFLDERAPTIVLNDHRPTVALVVRHTGDRPIQIGSHYHFFEVNRALHFERDAAYGYHLDIPAGTAVRFEPGEEKQVSLVVFGGGRIIHGHQGAVNGPLDDPAIRAQALGGGS